MAKTISQLPKREPNKSSGGTLYCCIGALRDKHGLRLREVAKHSGVSPATISRIEQGAECNLTQALKLANFFETTVEKIWNLK